MVAQILLIDIQRRLSLLVLALTQAHEQHETRAIARVTSARDRRCHIEGVGRTRAQRRHLRAVCAVHLLLANRSLAPWPAEAATSWIPLKGGKLTRQQTSQRVDGRQTCARLSSEFEPDARRP